MLLTPRTLVLALATALPLLVQAAPAPSPSLQTLLEQQHYDTARPIARALLALRHPSGAQREQIYAWLFTSDNLAELDQRLQATLAGAGVVAADEQAAGRLALEGHALDKAQAAFERAQSLAATPLERANALKGLGQVATERRDYDTAIKLLDQSVQLAATADGLAAQAETLIRLGRADDAITALNRAVAINPLHPLAQYDLGNGYERKNYTELEAGNPVAFKEAMALVHRASDAFDRGQYGQAQRLSQEALQRCPDLGRAHAVLAMALWFERLSVSVHRAAAEARFDAQPMPVVPGIEQYVSNWASLTPRQQKRVALSVAPWAAFVPVLVEGGARFYIKPLSMLLSETPNMHSLRDQRIEYDSRLWDDVRGAGGHFTVTGAEDVERMIFDYYNTVLHEMSHQVHEVLTAEQRRQIQDLYRRAKERDAATHQGFLSRYAGGSVYEYFAEGANSLMTPQRDAYDFREIVRERLQRIDPDLMALEQQLMAIKDTSASLPVALVSAGDQALSDGHVEQARSYYDRAAKVAPDDERVLTAQIGVLNLEGQAAPAGALAALTEKVLKDYSASGGVRVSLADAQWHGGKPLADVAAALAAGRAAIPADKGEDRYRVDLELGELWRKLGDAPKALESYQAALAYQADSPDALWGLASSLALAGRWDEAFSRYDQAVRLRTGLPLLRADYARDLLLAGRIDVAQAQIAAGLQLDPDEPQLLALDALRHWLQKDRAGALQQAEAALKQGPWCDLAAIVKAAASETAATYTPSETLPSYVFDTKRSMWRSVHEHPAAEARVQQLLTRP